MDEATRQRRGARAGARGRKVRDGSESAQAGSGLPHWRRPCRRRPPPARGAARAQAAAERRRRRHEAEAALQARPRQSRCRGRQAEAAADILRRALRAQASAATAERRAELTARLATGRRACGPRFETARRRPSSGPPKARRRLEALAEEPRVLREDARERGGVALTMDYADGRTAGVSIDGVALPDGDACRDPGRRHARDRGHRPADGASRRDADATRWPRPRGARRGACEAGATRRIEAVARIGGRRAEAEARRRDAERTLNAVAPEGIDALREAIARAAGTCRAKRELPGRRGGSAGGEPGSAGFRRREHGRSTRRREAVGAAQDGRGGARRRRWRAQRRAVARAARRAQQLRRRRDRAAPRRGACRAQARCSARRCGSARRSRPPRPISTRQRRRWSARARSSPGAEEDRHRIRVELGKLDTAIEMQAAEAVEEELADVEIRLDGGRAQTR